MQHASLGDAPASSITRAAGLNGGGPEIEDVMGRSSAQRRPLLSQAAGSHAEDFSGAGLKKGSVRLDEQRA